ncbi:SDR family oxidoreductase [Acuticoccus sp. M5D2P5]|uniref:SDR family NAD(P)-dependent oxidoreductase n=1 Tax=Acuticoccus kalidii TaxID=2910977 RepID=UPI001F2C0539|nr:SDR family oxidoreductase [Acuticoccus kalidii]MCF3934974.1 SDR family oxidoreductase [Acuticoccus kalidii]
MTNPTPLAGKAALVTGGSRGIGAAIVTRLAADGADVAFSYVAATDRAEALVREVVALGRRAFAIRSDQSDPAEVKRFVETAHKALGAIDILVNSAGAGVFGTVDDPAGDPAALDRQIDINVRGTAAAVRAAVPLMKDGGRIVSIGTSGSDHMPFPGFADYGATKAAVRAYARGWARDLGARNITVNVVEPGSIDTESNPQTGPHADVQRALSPLGRYGRPEDVAGAVAFLVGPDAAYVNGAALKVDGGQSA